MVSGDVQRSRVSISAGVTQALTTRDTSRKFPQAQFAGMERRRSDVGTPTPGRSPPSNFIGFTLKTSTWVSNSHGLYDYESHHVSAKTYRCHGRSSVYRVLRKGVDVTLVTDGLGRDILSRDSEVHTIAKLVALDVGGYAIESPGFEEDFRIRKAYRHSVGAPEPVRPSPSELDTLQDDSRIWVVVRSLKDASLPLRPGDYVKLGRLGFKVKQLVLNQEDEHQMLHELLAGGRHSALEGDDDDLVTCETRPFEAARENEPGSVNKRGSSPLSRSVPNQQMLMSHAEHNDEISGPRNRAFSDYDPSNRDLATEQSGEERRQSADSSQRSSDNETTHLMSGPGPEKLTDPPSAPAASPQLLLSRSSLAQPLCRVCLGEEEDPINDPLLSACRCDGSMKWIHLMCLRKWMQGRLNIKNDEGGTTCFFWRPLECEICQEPYPTYIDLALSRPGGPNLESKKLRISDPKPTFLVDPLSRVYKDHAPRQSEGGSATAAAPNSLIIELFEIPKPTVPFVVLESKHQPSGNAGFHFISFHNRNTVKLGRGHEADIRVADISVSRVHSALRFEPSPTHLQAVLKDYNLPPIHHGHRNLVHGDSNTVVERNPLGHALKPSELNRPYVYVEDLKSKFGTLVAVDKPVILYPRMVLSLQVGRTVLAVYVRKPTWSRLIPSCFNLYYRGLVPRKLRRNKRRDSFESGENSMSLRMDIDTHDVRLLETYLPLSMLGTHGNPTPSAPNATANPPPAALPDGNAADQEEEPVEGFEGTDNQQQAASRTVDPLADTQPM